MIFKAQIMDEKAIQRAITRLAHEVIEKNKGVESVVIVGIQSRGIPLAELIAEKIYQIEGVKVSCGSVDISMYRDDKKIDNDFIDQSKIDFDINNKVVVLVDDVIFTGRTIRSAMDALIDRGRPSAIQLAVLVDRGHRELPIRADFVGKNVPTSRKETVKVKFKSLDGDSEVSIYQKD